MLSVGGIVGGTFGFVRRNIGAIATWWVVYMVAAVVASLLMRPMIEAQLTAMASAPPQLPEGFLGYMALMYLIFGATFLTLFNATFRAVLKPEQGSVAYLRLGMDELRLLGLMIVLGLGWCVVLLALIIVTVIIGILVALVAGAGGTGAVAVLIYLALIAAALYLVTRLSPAAPLTLIRGRITIVEAWKLTKGRFWTLFGGYISIVLIVAVPFICVTVIMIGGMYHQFAVAPYDPAAFSGAMRAQMEMQRPGTPMWFFGVIVGGFLGSLGIAMQGAMTAIATRALLDLKAPDEEPA